MKFKKGVFSMDLNWFEEMEARIPKDGVRTRFAPSPTGYMHVGNLRTALYTWLIARHSGGKFILRIEDTDQGRLVEGATEVIYATLRKCGLTWDEGPDIGGPVGPYIQTERRALYGKYAELLVEKGHAYYCFCEKTESEEDSGNFDRAADPCRDMSLEDARAKVAAGAPYVIRQKIPAEGSTVFSDAVFGDITVENSTLDDQVLIKRDGLPTYNFANVIDDHLMGITHVVRGSEYLSSAPKYNLLYQGFGWDVPTYIHCSPVMRDAHNKMSKRKGDPSYEDLIAMGYLSEAVVNYVTLLGWSPRGEYAEREFFTLAELAEIFDIGGISKSPAIFDIEKLTYFNAHYLREMSPEAFHAAALPYIRQAVQNPALSTEEIAGLLQARCERLTDIPEKLDFFDALPDYDAELFTNKKSKTNPEVSRRMLEAVLPALDGLADWTVDGIHDALIGLAESLEVKNATLMWPVRIAAAGKAVTPGGAVEICHILGKDECLRRLRLGLDKLGG
ncbi:glutamate--tRNA ligase [Flavonifractor plautii ATCC 29863]|uniref:Glutamate--tRNA ligase n=2 Tax=Flavonifractor plautii TaxID=292800 RepID=G9YLE2_FLAPL|nr:glutamate--tRNA ligase [Flavonifractor plautii ATCC 29863]